MSRANTPLTLEDVTQSVVECVLRFDVEKYVFFSPLNSFFERKECCRNSEQDYYPIDDYGESKIKSEQWIRKAT